MHTCAVLCTLLLNPRGVEELKVKEFWDKLA